MTTQRRIYAMEAALQSGMAPDATPTMQRQALASIVRHAHFAGVGPLDWLLKQLEPTAKTTVTRTSEAEPVFVCDVCGEPFATKHALCGHKKKHRGVTPK